MYLYPIDPGMRDACYSFQQVSFDVALNTDLLSLQYRFSKLIHHIARLLLGVANIWLLKTLNPCSINLYPGYLHSWRSECFSHPSGTCRESVAFKRRPPYWRGAPRMEGGNGHAEKSIADARLEPPRKG